MDTKEMLSYYLTVNIHSICRVCLEKPNVPQKLTPIFDPVKPPHFSNLIMACAAVQVVENDGLPAYLCEDCISQLQNAFQFKTKCETSDLRLREYITLTTTTCAATTSQLQLTNGNDVITSMPSIKAANDNVFNVLSSPVVLNNNPTDVLSLNSNTMDTNSILLNTHTTLSNDSVLNSVIDNSNGTSLDTADLNRSSVPNISTDTFIYKQNFIINIANSESLISLPTESHNDTNTYTDLQQLESQPREVMPPQVSQQPSVQHVLAEPDLYINMKKEPKFTDNPPTDEDSIEQIHVSNDNSLENEFLILRKNNNTTLKNDENFDAVKSEAKDFISAYQINNEKQPLFLLDDSDENVKSEYVTTDDTGPDQQHFLIVPGNEKNKFKKRTGNKKRTVKNTSISNVYNSKLPKKHQCDSCGKIFKAKQGLIQHIRIHSGERPYLCHLCNKRFINGGHLHTHMRTHTGEKNHKCTECVKAFATAQQLHKHVIAIHTQERPYQCSFCPKRCASSSNLTTHVRIHTGEKNYHCDRCPKAFSTKGQLLQHILIHTGQKPFYCEVCQKRFTQRAHLTRHMKMHKQPTTNL